MTPPIASVGRDISAIWLALITSIIVTADNPASIATSQISPYIAYFVFSDMVRIPYDREYLPPQIATLVKIILD
jgi:hypothetical protein